MFLGGANERCGRAAVVPDERVGVMCRAVITVTIKRTYHEYDLQGRLNRSFIR
jgi:hypothetical protein